ncbi:MAG: hypothetical protein AYK19_00085 [Theionarchaea archaeon DG-70-1]|nr:MAG: hypothetical protein AYK19_00085 [Theionarchaea archaeon DG-70-1]
MTNENNQKESRSSKRLLEHSLKDFVESLDKFEECLGSIESQNSTIKEKISDLRETTRKLKSAVEGWYKFRRHLNDFLDSCNELDVSKDFNSQLSITNRNSDQYEDGITEVKNCLRQVIEDLTFRDILTYNLSWPRRYLYERTCHGKLQEYKNGFIYKVLQSYKSLNNLDEESLEKQWGEIDKAFKEFYEIVPASPCLRTKKSEEERKGKNLGERAFTISNTLLRIFFFGGVVVNLLKYWEKYEDLIYFAEEKYRDHCLHLFYDFLLGCVILEGLIPRIHHYWECYSGECVSLDEVYVRIMRRWIIASLFHDIGYTAQSLKNVSYKIRKEFFTKVPGFDIAELGFSKKPPDEQINDFCTSLARILSEDEFSFEPSDEAMDSYDYPVYRAAVNLLTNQLDKMDHGVMSALFVLLVSRIDIHELTLDVNPDSKPRSHVILREKFKRERKKLAQDTEVAALSIAIHNMRQADVEGITIDFRSHPITFLLMLCDDLHEWDRKLEWKKKEEIITNVYGFDVRRRLDNPQQLFKREVKYGDGTEDETLFNFLFRYMVRKEELQKSKDKEKLEGFKKELIEEIGELKRKGFLRKDLSEQLEKLLGGEMPDNLEDIKKAIDVWLKNNKENEKLKDFVKKLKIVRMALMQLADDVITFIYVGGDEKKKGQEGDRVTKMWKTFKKLFIDNLSHGPAICILHAYNENEGNELEFFFIAEYDEALKVYRVDEELDPEKNL